MIGFLIKYRLYLGVLFLFFFLVLLLYLRFYADLDYVALVSHLAGFDNSYIYFIVLYSVLTVFMVPTLPLNLGAGFLWGVEHGFMLSLASTTLGSSISFVLARYLISDDFIRNSLWCKMLLKLDEGGIRMLAYVRINPLFPSPPLNYMYGLTSIGLVKYTLVSMFSVAPVVYVFSFLGNVFSITNEADEAVFKVSVFLFLVTSVLAVLFKSYKKYYE